MYIGHDDGTVEERRIVTSRERFAAVLGERSPARILLEASTESEWVARWLEQLGHEVIVADPNFAPMYATRSRHTKTDRRDARTLMEACRLGAYRPAYRVSDARRHVRAELAVREALVRTRTRYIALAKALVRRDGLRVAASEAHLAARRIGALELSAALRIELAPLFTVLEPLNAQIAAADRRIEAASAADPTVALLMTAPSIGPISRRGGTSARRHSLRHVARRSAVPGGEAPRAASPQITNHDVCLSEPRQRNRVEMTDERVASASQLMAAGESRELVSAVHSIARPKCAVA